ncbi:MAG: class I SAM-dependent methyltransferase [Magnetococcales bacterium]|nr:class I SAM-dependent methyltransferase [Magnetococcales bacterium]
MNGRLGTMIAQRIPLSWRQWRWRWQKRQEAARVRRIFDAAPDQPRWLDAAELERLNQEFTRPYHYGYDQDNLIRRGEARSQELAALIADFRNCQDFLELACHDGMVSSALASQGKRAVATDVSDSGFNEAAKRAGVLFSREDAMKLTFPDESFDVVFSFDGMPHIPDPGKALEEATRVTRRGQYIFMRLGSHYSAPFALHAYKSIFVPYCQFLFTRETMQDYLAQRNLKPLDFESINHWHLSDFRALWRRFSDRLEILHLQETPELNSIGLVGRYPSCFKGKVPGFEDLTVSRFEVLFRKK